MNFATDVIVNTKGENVLKHANKVLFAIFLAILGLAVMIAPQTASANPTYFSLVPADKQAEGCNLCHDGAPPALNATGKKVEAANPADKDAMAKALSGDSAAKEKPAAQPAAQPQAKPAATAAQPKATAAPKVAAPSYKTVQITLGKGDKEQEVKAVEVNESVLIALKDAVGLLGGNLSWDAKSRTAAYDNWQGTVASFNVKSNTVKINDKEFKDVGLRIINSRVYVPLAFLGERLDTRFAVKFAENDLGKHAIVEVKWSQSAHAVPVESPAGRDTCVSCHNGDGFDQGVTKVADLQNVGSSDYKGQYCTTCHGTRGKSIRNGGVVTLANGITANMGYGALCASCHNSRRNNLDEQSLYKSKSAPHVGPQADVLTATGGMEFDGHIYPSSPHNANPDTCISCHMAKDENGVANHTWDVEQAFPCAKCHDGLDTVNRTALGDYDGDGTIEGIQDEVEGLVELVQGAISQSLGGGSLAESHGSFKFLNANGDVMEDVPFDVYKAAWNVGIVENDGSEGVHNPAYVVTLLQQSYKALTGNDVANARIR